MQLGSLVKIAGPQIVGMHRCKPDLWSPKVHSIGLQTKDPLATETLDICRSQASVALSLQVL